MTGGGAQHSLHLLPALSSLQLSLLSGLFTLVPCTMLPSPCPCHECGDRERNSGARQDAHKVAGLGGHSPPQKPPRSAYAVSCEADSAL